MDLRQTREWARYLQGIGWEVVEEQQGGRVWRLYKRRLSPVPISILKVQRVPLAIFKKLPIRQIAREQRAIVTYVEIEDQKAENKGWEKLILEMKRLGYKATMDAMLPTKTRWFDLHLTEAQILAQMKPKTRYNIKLAQKHGLVVQRWTGMDLVKNPKLGDEFYRLFQANARRIGLWGMPRTWFKANMIAFRKQALVVMVRDEAQTELLAAGVFLCSEDTAFYFFNGSTENGRKVMAPTLVVWEGALWAKERGFEGLDLEGVVDERRPLKAWRGFTRFKEGFGGEVRYCPPAFRRWF